MKQNSGREGSVVSDDRNETVEQCSELKVIQTRKVKMSRNPQEKFWIQKRTRPPELR